MVKLLVFCFSITQEEQGCFFFFSAEAQDFRGLVKTAHFHECRCNQVFVLVIIRAICKHLHVRIVAVLLIA